MKLFKSMSLLQKEKLVVIKKELLHLYNISHFYKSTDSNMRQRKDISTRICMEVENHIKLIQSLHKKIEKNKNSIQISSKKIISFLTKYDLHNNEIKDLLQSVKFIQSKLTQFLQDDFNQYIPIPMTSKRYSSKGFLNYLKDYYKDIIQGICEIDDELPNNIVPMIFWGHNTSFTALSHLDESGQETHYIETAYWNYEIPTLLPIMSHELGHIILNQKKNTLFDLYSHIRNDKAIQDNFNISSIEKNTFLDEVVSDLFAYLSLEDTYIIVMAHELLGKGFSSLFYDETNEDVNYGLLDTTLLHFNEPLIRLLILLEFRKANKSPTPNTEQNNLVANIEKIIKNIMPSLLRHEEKLDMNSIQEFLFQNTEYTSLLEIYSTFYPNLFHEYDKLHAAIYSSVNSIVNYFTNEDTTMKVSFHHDLEQINNKINSIDSITTYKQIFNELWETRLKHINLKVENTNSVSKNTFRKLILKNGSTSHNHDNDSDIYRPYELSLFKTRTDAYQAKTFSSLFGQLNTDIQTFYYSNPLYPNEKKNEKVSFTFDLFTGLNITHKNELTTEINLNEYLSNTLSQDNRYFYTYKHSLIKIASDIRSNQLSQEQTPKFNLIFQLQLIHNNSTYTNNACDAIKTYFDEKTDIAYNVIEIFKSLGPKEIVLNIQNIDLDTIYTLKSDLIKLQSSNGGKPIFRRSYSIPYGNMSEIEYEKISEKYIITSILRLKSEATNELIKTLLHSFKSINTILHTTGITDIQIIWKENTKIRSIFACYTKLIKNNYTSDIQTKINEVFPFPEELKDA